MDSNGISDELRAAIRDLIAWYDESNDGGDPTIIDLDQCVKALNKHAPPADTDIGSDINTIVNFKTKPSRVHVVETIERLRFFIKIRAISDEADRHCCI